MQKTQTFSCLFRHYAKHNGLKKEDLVFSFVDELLPEQTPESVHLMPNDEITVTHRKLSLSNELKMPEISSDTFINNFKEYLFSEKLSDITFFIQSDKEYISCHKVILSARSQYFNAMFREGGVSNTSRSIVDVSNYSSDCFKCMLEFIYSNSIQNIENFDAKKYIDLLVIANEYILEDMTILCSSAATKVFHVDNIAKFILISVAHEIEDLKEACIRFVRSEKNLLRNNKDFCLELENSPEIGILLIDALQDGNDCFNDGNNIKRARIGEANSSSQLIPALSNAIQISGTLGQSDTI